MPLLRPLYRTNSRKQATNFPIQITLIHNVWSSAFDGSTRVLSMSFRGAMFRCIVVSLIAMLTALASSSVTSTSAALWSWPLDPAPAVLRAFHRPTHPWMSGHRGVDLAARFGQEIYAPADGVVVFTGRVVNRTVISLEVKSGHRISFEPVADPAPKGAKFVRATSLLTETQPFPMNRVDRASIGALGIATTTSIPYFLSARQHIPSCGHSRLLDPQEITQINGGT